MRLRYSLLRRWRDDYRWGGARLANDLFWYAQADGDFYSWARSHARGMDVTISDSDIYVSQVQGPLSTKVLEAASDDGMPEPFGYFGIARVRFGGQEVVISRTGYTNELGWEFYTEPHHDAQAAPLFKQKARPTVSACMDLIRCTFVESKPGF